MTRYYAARVHDSHDMQRDTVMVTETAGTYDGAMGVHIDRISRETVLTLNADGTPRVAHWRDTVLLDLGSFDAMADESQLRRILMTDPVLHAIYELGRRHELLNSLNRRDARLENPECCASGSCEVCRPGARWSDQ